MMALYIASHVSVRSFAAMPPPDPLDRRSQIMPVNLRDLVAYVPKPELKFRDDLLSEQDKRLRELFREENLVEKPKVVLKPVIRDLGKNLLQPRPRLKARAPSQATSPAPEILSIDAAALPAQRQAAANRSLIPDIPRFRLGAGPTPAIVSLRPTKASPGSPQELELSGFRISLPGRPPRMIPAPEQPPVVIPRIDKGPEQIVTHKQTPNVLDYLVKVEVTVRADPRTGGGHFRVDISPNEASERLVSVPKDVLFLLDASASITPEKLEEFKRGLGLALDYLDAEDRFNVVVFRIDPKPLFDRFVPSNKETLAKAREFIRPLRSKGKTDVYAGLAPFVLRERAQAKQPLMIFLISDGRTTTGSRLTDNIFLQRIAKENKALASIFCFSTGDKTNLFLMDYLSYKNRGFSLHTRDVETSSRQLTDYVGSLSDIIVTDLRCKVSGDLVEEVYPRELSHLFRDHPLTVWGRFPAGAKEIAVQIIGFGRDGSREELVLKQELKTAAAGGPKLGTRWAAQKIYYLVSEWATTNNAKAKAEIKAEIKQLADRFNIIVPY